MWWQNQVSSFELFLQGKDANDGVYADEKEDLNVFGIVLKCLEKTNIRNKNIKDFEHFVFTIWISKILRVCAGVQVSTLTKWTRVDSTIRWE